MIEGQTIKDIRDAVKRGDLKEPFRAADVNKTLGIHWAGNFLPKHRVGNPSNETELFIQKEKRGTYCLKDSK